MEAIRTKNYADTYLYGKYPEYEKRLFNFIMKAEVISKVDDSFEDIRYDIKKKQVTSSLAKVLDSNKVILAIHNEPLPKAFKVFTAKDVKGDNKYKVFIDCTNLIFKDGGKLRCNNIDILVSYLASAMNQYIYYIEPKRIVMNNTICSNGAECFSSLFTHIIDYVEKISIIPSTKNKCQYLAALYFQTNILRKELNDGVKSIAKRVSGLSEREEEIILLQLSDNAMLNIKLFLDAVSKILRLNNITLDLFLEKWLYLYGQGTVFALEMYPAFAEMIINAYVGCYINNQKTIEKITGKHIVDFTNAIFKIGVESV